VAPPPPPPPDVTIVVNDQPLPSRAVLKAFMTSVGDPLTWKYIWMPLSAMVSGPLVCWLFSGVGISDGNCALSLADGAAVACEVGVAAALLLEVALVAPVVWVPELVLLQAEATRPTVIAAAAKAHVLRLMLALFMIRDSSNGRLSARANNETPIKLAG
jgi:hypothetical protein